MIGFLARRLLLAIPTLVGVLVVESPRPGAFDELDEVLLGIVGNQAATAIDNARTYQLVERLGRLKRFFSPQLAEAIVTGGADDPLRTHRREVTVVFLDLRGFTAFAETADPEDVMGVLREYHDLEYAEIADVLELDVGTVKSRLSRARAALREHLIARMPELGGRR